jgi:hypothetical protein
MEQRHPFGREAVGHEALEVVEQRSVADAQPSTG